MSTNSNMASIVFACLVLFGLTDFCKSQVTITTQPSDVAVPSGGTAVFTCVVDLGDRNANTDDIKWDNMGNAITRVSTDPYMVENDFEEGDQLISTLTIKNVNTQHAGLYQFVLSLSDGDVMSREAFLSILTATITTQPQDVTVCTRRVAMFTCVVDRNGTNITSDDVMWQQIRVGGGISTLSTSLTGGVPFNITTTISGDILTSTLTITGVTDSNVQGTSSYRCVVNDVMSRNASLHFSTGTPMNIRFSEITSTSFDIQWDKVDDADWYIVIWRDDGGSVNQSTTSVTVPQLSPNTTYSVTVTAGNLCGSGTASDILNVTTNVTLLVGSSISPSSLSSSVITTASTINSMATLASSSVMTATSSMSSMTTIPPLTTTTPVASSSGGGGGAGGIIGGVVGGIIAVVTVIINIVVLYWFCVYKKKGGADLEKETYAALQSPTGSFAKDAFPESHYDAVDKPGTRVVPHQSSAGGVEYAVSTKTASMASLNEPPPEYAYAAVDKKKHIVGIIPHQSLATGVQYAVSTKAAEANEPHRYDEIRDEPGNVPHQTAATGAVYAVSSKSTAHQHDDVKDKSPQGISYAEIQHGSTSGVKVSMGDDPVVKYTQVA